MWPIDIAEAATMAQQVFTPLMHRYGMTISTVDEDELLLTSPTVQIRFLFNRGLTEYVVHIWVGTEGPFRFKNVYLLRENLEPNLQDEVTERTLANIDTIQDFAKTQELLLTYCKDLLEGNTASLVNKERYFDFDRLMKLSRTYLTRLYASRGDPTRLKKLVPDDWTWLKKPWERYQRGEAPFPDMPDIR